MTPEQKLVDFLVRNYNAEAGAITPTTDLVESGILDSSGVLDFVAFIEQQFSVKVDDEDVTVDNFGTVARALEFVRRGAPP